MVIMLLGLLFPLILIVLLKSKLKWQVVRLFSSSIFVFGLAQLLIQLLDLNLLIQYILFFIIAFCETSNLEHVINNNSNQNFIFLKFLLDPVFLKGSGLTKKKIIRLSVFLLSLL